MTGANTNTNPFALITGASKGLGKEIAKELASRKFNLLLVSLKNEGLSEFSRSLQLDYHVEVHFAEADLSESQTVFTIAEWAASKGDVSVLINNAGIGGTRAFEEASVEYIDNIIQLNIRATSLLTRLMLPVLMHQKQAYILNVASMASFCPIAWKTVYPASKAFIWSFSRGLNQELRDTGVFVSVIHPGPMKTNADVTRRIENQSMIGKLGVLTTQRTARIAVNRLFNRTSLIIPGFFNKINWLMSKVVPMSIRVQVMSNVMKKELKPYVLYPEIGRKMTTAMD